MELVKTTATIFKFLNEKVNFLISFYLLSFDLTQFECIIQYSDSQLDGPEWTVFEKCSLLLSF